MQKTSFLILLICIMLLTVSPALAYIGPGAGISVLGSLLGILATIFVAIGAILFWPLRKFMQRRKARRESMESGQAGQAVDRGTNDKGTRRDS